MTQVTLDDDNKEKEISLAQSRAVSITNRGPGDVKVHLDKQGESVSAVDKNATVDGKLIGNPITVEAGKTFVVLKTQLLYENIKIGIDGDGFNVTVIY
jgi:hypothetical protein